MPDAELQAQDRDHSPSEATAPVENSDGKEEPENLLALAEQLYQKGKLGECLVVLEAAKVGGSAKEQIDRQKVVVQMQTAAKKREWWKVLHVEEGSAEREVRASYKKLAQQIHPDKCSCFGAERAFQFLTEAVSFALGAADGGFVKQAPGGGEQHAWWDKWDADPSSTKRKRKREEELVPQSEEETLYLRQCPLEELKAEVAKLQSEVLRPEKDSPASKLTAAQRSQRVRAARALLNERLSYAKNGPQKRGGFL